ncbi:MAG: hypothetical protein N4A61_01930 [Pelagimonas sp.]|nr:hypothetical protein [Pelagimonas sp.]
MNQRVSHAKARRRVLDQFVDYRSQAGKGLIHINSDAVPKVYPYQQKGIPHLNQADLEMGNGVVLSSWPKHWLLRFFTGRTCSSWMNRRRGKTRLRGTGRDLVLTQLLTVLGLGSAFFIAALFAFRSALS